MIRRVNLETDSQEHNIVNWQNLNMLWDILESRCECIIQENGDTEASRICFWHSRPFWSVLL